jgi:hypothetical protein
MRMTITVDGHRVPAILDQMPCGGTPIFDHESGTYSYRCDSCFAVIGSIGQPQSCKDINEFAEKMGFENANSTACD